MSRAIVIGAGISGLAAARTLVEGGIECRIVEARERIGGRIWTFRGGPAPVDLGASWLHGMDNNPLVPVARAAGLSLRPTDFNNTAAYDQMGRRLSEEVVAAIRDQTGLLMDLASELAWEAPSDMPLSAAVPQAMARYQAGHLPGRRGLASQGTEDMDQLSARGDPERRVPEGHDALLTEGYDHLLEHVAEGLDIQLGTTVRHVEWSDTGVRVDGEEVDHAVCTLPVGVLRSGHVVFEPLLPAAHRDAIEGMGVGRLNKLALLFEKPFWPKDVDFIQLPTTVEGLFPTFLCGADSLIGFVSGRAAEQAEGESDEAALQKAMALLRGTFRQAVSEPLQWIMTHWLTDPYARGSYSILTARRDASLFDVLAQPVGRLHMAGEATWRQAPGTVHGAWESGRRAALAILGRPF